MLIMPYIRFLLFALLAAFLPLVDAKGGGGGGKGGGGKSGGSKGSTSGGKITKTTIIVNGQNRTECRDSKTNQIVQCPKSKKGAIIAGAVIGSVVGLLLIAILVYYIVKRRNGGKKGESGGKTSKATLKADDESKKEESKPLVGADGKSQESV